jgi:serine protease
MRQVWELGVVLVAAAGNDGSGAVSFPAGYPHVLGVGATGPNDQVAFYSNWGPGVDVVAPGGGGSEFYCGFAVDILTATLPPASPCPGAPSTSMDPNCACSYDLTPTTTLYVAEAGTSFSAPIVSGLAAVLLGVDPARTPDQVATLIEATADQPQGGRGWNQYYGYGRVNMYRALTNAVTALPTNASLAWTYPNPFSPTSGRCATFVVPTGRGKAISIEIRDVLGNLLWSKAMSAAETAGLDLYYNSPLQWNGRDSKGRELANGVYTARITVGSTSCTKRIVIAR